MIQYEDLLPNVTNEYLAGQSKFLQEHIGNLDMENPNDRWLAVTYIYGLDNGLKEYQARSFASELTLFLTKQLYNTDVGLVYREDWIDSHFYAKFESLNKKYGNKSKEFWKEFIEYMITFYSTSLSWKYERVGKYLKFRINAAEKEMFEMIPKKKPKERFIYLLEYYPYDISEVEIHRKPGGLDKEFAINLTRGEYDRFMQVLGSTKTQKFLNLLYYWYAFEIVKG